MAHLFYFEDKDIKKIQKLFDRKIDNEYFILCKNSTFADIVQYSCKYQNVHLASVPIQYLDPNQEFLDN